MNTIKRGRPPDDPKNRREQAKLDEDATIILNKYCESIPFKNPETVSRAIKTK